MKLTENITEEVDSLIAGWLNQMEVQLRYSENTVICYKRDLIDFLNFLSKHINDIVSVGILRDLKIIDFRSWLSDRIDRELSARSNARALSSIRSFFYYLAKRKFLDTKVINEVKRSKLPHLLPKPIPEENLIEFLEQEFYFENDLQWVTDRDRALYTLLYSTGLRINEALRIRTKDVAPEMTIKGKGKKDRVIILFPITMQRINTYIKSCPFDLSNDYLFLGLRGKQLLASTVDVRLKKLQELNNLPDRSSAHAFRHSFATHMVQRGADIRAVQELLGHESLESTQIYTSIDDYNLLRMYEKTHPLELSEKNKTDDDQEG